MENQEVEQQAVVDQVYGYAAELLVKRKHTSYEVKSALMAKGLDEESATVVVENLEAQINKAKNTRANKDMLYGALWCVGGIALTVADIGFIFWGAIVFGGVQFVRGAMNYQK